MNSLISSFYRLRKILTCQQLLLCYKTYVQPNIQYAVLIYGAACKIALDPLELKLKHLLRIAFGLKKHDSVSSLRENFHILTGKELHLKELLKLLVETLRSESPLEDINLLITPAEVQLLSKMRNKAKSIKPNKKLEITVNQCVRVRKFLNAMLKLEPYYAQQIIEIEKSRIKCFRFSNVRNYIQDNADLLSLFF